MSFKSVKQWGKLFVLLQASAIIQLTIPKLTIAQNNPVDLQKTINFGFAEDAYPISATLEGLNKDTFCSELLNYLKTQEYIKENDYTFDLIKVPYKHRFIQQTIKYSNKNIQLDINCGSMSITNDRIRNLAGHYMGHFFSISYFKTPSKYIIIKQNYDTLSKQFKDILDNNEDIDIGEDNAIAVIDKTTQAEFLKKKLKNKFKYNNICFVESREKLYLLLEEGSAEAKDCQEEEKEADKIGITKKVNIVAYSSDDIILKGILSRFSKIREKYKYSSLKGEIQDLGLVIYEQRIPKESDEYYRNIDTRNIILARIVNDWINETGIKWINDKNKELDRQLVGYNIVDFIKNNIILFLIFILVIIGVVTIFKKRSLSF
ncbi:transporter substrate-binding domain-containing protein [Aphanothece sacrum]|uniref:transporter substrate-binding domain-containing protein n=1 Tax=Aphanothece sacrum TaxID=1122 RepID=UPI000F604FBE|nr:transporter substrate-binding domain-containing protein [Aphanothece sacrum]GBF84499.1 hypothetical protein AsFPU3_1548 [Aphanothece sacrum FPU3]